MRRFQSGGGRPSPWRRAGACPGTHALRAERERRRDARGRRRCRRQRRPAPTPARSTTCGNDDHRPRSRRCGRRLPRPGRSGTSAPAVERGDLRLRRRSIDLLDPQHARGVCARDPAPPAIAHVEGDRGRPLLQGQTHGRRPGRTAASGWSTANGRSVRSRRAPPLGLAARPAGRARGAEGCPGPPASQTAAASSTASQGPKGAAITGTSIPSRSHSGVCRPGSIIGRFSDMPQAFYAHDGDVGEIVLDAPPLNLFSAAMFDDLEAAIAHALEAEPRALIFRAQGDVVSAGVDVHVFEGLDAAGADALTARLMAFSTRSRTCPSRHSRSRTGCVSPPRWNCHLRVTCCGRARVCSSGWWRRSSGSHR